jgi:hypothetical protein
MRSIYCAILFVLAMALLAPLSYAADFSASVVSTMRNKSTTAKMYVSGDKSRMEMTGAIAINRLDKKVVWMLMPQQNMYMEQQLDLSTAASIKDKVVGETSRKVVGNEVISGVKTTKYLVTYKTAKLEESLYQWIDEAKHIPVKTAAIDGTWSTEFRDIKSGPQDPKLFEIPGGYQKMQMPKMSDMFKLK